MSLLRDIAEMVAGLQVPYSVRSEMLGTAGPAWVKVWKTLGLVGWSDVDDIEEALRAQFSERGAKE